MFDFPDLVNARPPEYKEFPSDLEIHLGYDQRLINQARAEFKRLALEGHDHAALVRVPEAGGYGIKAFPTLSPTSWRGVPDEYRMQGGPVWSTGRLAPPEKRLLSREAKEMPVNCTAGALFKYPHAGFRLKVYFWAEDPTADGPLACLKMRRDGTDEIATMDIGIARIHFEHARDPSELWMLRLGRFAREASIAIEHVKPVAEFIVACQGANAGSVAAV